MNFTSKAKLSLAIVLTVALSMSLLTGCGKKKEEKQEVKIVYVNWAGTIAMTNLAKAVLESKMNVDVKLTVADVGPVYASLANGDQDAFLGSWLPLTHESYLNEYGEKLADLGYNFQGAKIGLVVPNYVEISSIAELNDIKDDLDGKIVGIDSGAGIMKATEKAIPAYELDLELVASSGPAMTASLKGAIDQNESIVVTGWRPHWKFARFDLKFLEDPEGIYGDVENIHTIARKDLEKDSPKIAQFFKNFMLNNDQLSGLMDKIEQSDGKPFEAAKMWMKENDQLCSSWIPKN